MRESDQAEIRDVARRWEEAWNSHDMAAMATLLAPDADFVNVSGRHWKGRQEIGASTHSVKPDALHPRARPRRVDAPSKRRNFVLAHGQRHGRVANPKRAQHEHGLSGSLIVPPDERARPESD